MKMAISYLRATHLDGLDGQLMDFQLNVPYINNQGICFSVLLLICESFKGE